jgi:hypothetical protein
MKSSVVFALNASLALAMSGCTPMSFSQSDQSSSQEAPKKTALDAPSLSCGTSTQTTININVTAGASGAPAGLSLQWMTNGDFIANGGWFLSEDGRLCKASFSGVPRSNINRFSLPSNGGTTVELGNLFDDEVGVSFNCNEDLACGTTYIIRAFSHNDPDSGRGKSAFSSNLTCATLACFNDGGCTYTQGYYKTHGPIPTGNNSYLWPASVQTLGLTIGNVVYTADQLLAIFNTPAQGNGLLSLTHQLIAAKLNVLGGADDSAVSATIASADALIGSLVVPPVGSGSLANSATSPLTSVLANFNEGVIGPGHCE